MRRSVSDIGRAVQENHRRQRALKSRQPRTVSGSLSLQSLIINFMTGPLSCQSGG